MEKWHLIIDVAKCENCNNCFLSCKDEYVDNDWPGYSASQPSQGQSWIRIQGKERRFTLEAIGLTKHSVLITVQLWVVIL